MRVGSLFSGIGGLDLGLERAGMQVVWQVEIDEWCRRVLAKHWPDVPKYADVRELAGDELEAVDLICGGFPCQPASSAGRRYGTADERWLWPEMVRLIRILRPRFVLVENVTGLLYRGLGDLLCDLAEVGYDAEWDCLRASEIGAHHQRERVYLLAYPHSGNGQTGLGSESVRPKPIFAGRNPERPTVRLASASWAPRGDDGVRTGLYQRRASALGNAVVPQVAEWIGRRIMEAAS